MIRTNIYLRTNEYDYIVIDKKLVISMHNAVLYTELFDCIIFCCLY